MFSTKHLNNAARKPGGGIVRAPFLAKYDRSSGPKVEGKVLMNAGSAWWGGGVCACSPNREFGSTPESEMLSEGSCGIEIDLARL